MNMSTPSFGFGEDIQLDGGIIVRSRNTPRDIPPDILGAQTSRRIQMARRLDIPPDNLGKEKVDNHHQSKEETKEFSKVSQSMLSPNENFSNVSLSSASATLQRPPDPPKDEKKVVEVIRPALAPNSFLSKDFGSNLSSPLLFPNICGSNVNQSSPNMFVSNLSSWVVDINYKKLDQARTQSELGAWDKRCIYRIAQCVEENEKKAYIPQTVSLGPYHYSNGGLRSMDEHKWRALYRVLKRKVLDLPQVKEEAQKYFRTVKALEAEARACYEGPIKLNSNKFVEMMVLDACFVLEILRGADTRFSDYSQNDPIFTMSAAIYSSIQSDMLLLENQIPLFILEKLSKLQTEKEGEVERLALKFFHPLIPTHPLPKLNELAAGGGLHCLDVFRRSLVNARDVGPQAERTGELIGRQQPIHCVTHLRDAGIKFKRKESHRFWDITFDRGVLHIPHLVIDDGTKSLFLNLIAYEQRHASCSNDITSYVMFMDNLIDSPNDVTYLRRCGIIENWMGSDAESADLFNSLGKEAVVDVYNCSFFQLSKDVKNYYQQRHHHWIASLKHKHFDNPWSVISLVAAVILLALTFMQTFYTIYAYYKPPS